MILRRPHARPGQRIGLLGGSFDPPHAGHVHLSEEALKLFGLDAVWWLVSPGNPLKAHGPAPLDTRLAACRDLVDDPRIVVTGIEARTGTRYTARTLRILRKFYPGVRFTWLMGADNLAQLHRWQEWRWIMSNVPVGVLARPGDRQHALHSKAARVYRGSRLKEAESHVLGLAQAPAWCFANMPMLPISSSELRRDGSWQQSE